MPVNDTDNVADAMGNCALCCVAGIRGTTAETERQTIDNELNVSVNDGETDMVFYELAVQSLGEPRDLTNPACLKKQVRGVAAWMARKGYSISYIGSVDNPLQPGVVSNKMLKYPNGTEFLYLVIDAGGEGEAHWIVARKNAGAISYTDYQLDIDNNMKYHMGRRTKRRDAPWGAPLVSNAPLEAFADPSRNTNRMMVIALADKPSSCCNCCYITTAVCGTLGLPDDCDELQTLRWFRDNIVLATEAGRQDVELYYATAPEIVRRIDNHPHAAFIYHELYDRFINPAVRAIKAAEYEAAYSIFKACVDESARLVEAH